MTTGTAPAVGSARQRLWRVELAETLKLGWPLIIAQLATISLATTDVIMMGWLGTEFLASGSLAHAVLFPFLLFGVGLLTAGAGLIAQAVGARDLRSVRRTVRQGFWQCALLGCALIPIIFHGEHLLRLIGQSEQISVMGGAYLQYACWQLFPVFVFIVLRNLVSAQGNTRVILFITLVAIALNALGNYALMFGNFGLPRMELRGAGLTTSLVHVAIAIMTLLHVLTHRRMRRYSILVRLWKADWPRFIRLVRIGLPIALMLVAETSLFAATGTLMGWIGTEELAAHAVALQLAAISFMVPLGLSHATTVRVGLAFGKDDAAARARAGWVSILISVVFMGAVATLFLVFPVQLVHLFLHAGEPANAVPIALAVSYLGIAALFQLVDGTQVTAAAALRGMNDTAVPMVIAIAGYWLVGVPVAYVLGFMTDLAGVGVWLGLASGLAFAAVLLVARWMWFQRKAQPGPT